MSDDLEPNPYFPPYGTALISPPTPRKPLSKSIEEVLIKQRLLILLSASVLFLLYIWPTPYIRYQSANGILLLRENRFTGQVERWDSGSESAWRPY